MLAIIGFILCLAMTVWLSCVLVRIGLLIISRFMKQNNDGKKVISFIFIVLAFVALELVASFAWRALVNNQPIDVKFIEGSIVISTK